MTPPTDEIRLERCTAADALLTVDWLVRQYGFARPEVEHWVRDLHFNWPLSVKALDPAGRVCGLLNMSDYSIAEESAYMAVEMPQRLARLDSLRHTAVFSFIVRDDFRHTPLNYRMFSSIMPDLRGSGDTPADGYDFVFIPVMHHLKTHRYWQRWGAREFYRDPDCVYYALPLTPAAVAALP